MDGQVTLRPASEDDLAMLEELTQDPEQTGEFGWFGCSDCRRWRRGWDENGLLGPDGGTLIVVTRRRAAGPGELAEGSDHPGRLMAGRSGIALVSWARGRGHGTQAHRLLARYLFAHTTAHRIWAGTEVGNIAEHKALEKAGFTREGVMRGSGWRGGTWRDGVIYSLLRTDPPV